MLAGAPCILSCCHDSRSPFKMPLSLLRLALAFTLALAALPSAFGQEARQAPTVELSAEASQRAANDLAQATAYVESSGIDAAALSRKVNEQIAAALEVAKAYPTVKVRTSGISTYPVYSRSGQSIESWRMRSDLTLESRDLPALSELLGKLQGSLAVTALIMQPAPETRERAADLAATDALRAFEARAAMISAALGKQYRIRHLSVNFGGVQRPVFPVMRSAALAAEAMAPPLEGGDSEVVVSVGGTIELLD